MTGTGTLLDPYIISTPADLDAVRIDLTAYYELGADIDLGAWGNWTPIGSGTYMGVDAFIGHFDGKGHTISNLTASGVECQGLFGCVGDGTVLIGITLVAVSVPPIWPKAGTLRLSGITREAS